MSSIWLLTDYGLEDPWVGMVKSVIERASPGTTVSDLTHSIPAGDVSAGATRLADCADWLPIDAIVVAVVDPGVGGPRRAVAVRSSIGPVLVGPDNGLLWPTLERLSGAAESVEISNSPWLPAPPSATFHGRDLFAPVAARLAAGRPVAEAGDRLDPDDLIRISFPEAVVEDGLVSATVAVIDRYGNVSLRLREDDCPGLFGHGGEVRVSASGRSHAATRARTFGGVPSGAMLLHLDADGRAAIAVNGGSAARELGVEAGSDVTLEWPA